MSYIPTEQVQQAREMDLLTYLQLHEPAELVQISKNNYCTREHDSLKISNGKWYWFSRGFGGVSALDYLVKVKEYTLPQAVEAIMGSHTWQKTSSVNTKPQTRQLLLPERNSNNNQVIRYLRSRGIHPEIIQQCIDARILYESKDHHNAVFIGMDDLQKPRYAAIRGTIGAYKGETTGSDKHYSFRMVSSGQATKLHLFESAIDLMSYASLQQMKGLDWKQDAMISLAGVFLMKREKVIPAALEEYLKTHPNVAEIHLHLDNDEVGRGAAQGIMSGLLDKYKIIDEPPLYGKDINEQLMITLGLSPRKKEEMVR